MLRQVAAHNPQGLRGIRPNVLPDSGVWETPETARACQLRDWGNQVKENEDYDVFIRGV